MSRDAYKRKKPVTRIQKPRQSAPKTSRTRTISTRARKRPATKIEKGLEEAVQHAQGQSKLFKLTPEEFTELLHVSSRDDFCKIAVAMSQAFSMVLTAASLRKDVHLDFEQSPEGLGLRAFALAYELIPEGQVRLAKEQYGQKTD